MAIRFWKYELLSPANISIQLLVPCLLIAVFSQYVFLPRTTVPEGSASYELARLGTAGKLYVLIPQVVEEQTKFNAHFYSMPPFKRDSPALNVEVTGNGIYPVYFESLINSDGTVQLIAEHAGSLQVLMEGSLTYSDSDFEPPSRYVLGGSYRLPFKMTIPISVAVSVRHRVEFGTYVFVPLYFGALAIIWFGLSIRRERLKIAEKVEQAESKAQAEPEKTKYAWDAARINLEAYFERNRLQVRQVFGIAIIVMSIGFVLVCFGVYLAMTRTDTIKPALVAGISGIITQFIGATFMVIYRSTMTQANEFMVILERINTVGMAIQVLELIPEGESALKNESRAKIVELLLSGNVSTKTKKSKAAGE